MRSLATTNYYGFGQLVTGCWLEMHKIFEQVCDTFTLALTYLSPLWNYLTKNVF